MIPAILERPPGNAGLVGLNALYFKDRWQTPFEAEATKPAPFQTAGGSTIEVPMMALRAGPAAPPRGSNFVALDLPYAHERFSMTVITTKDKPARAAQFERLRAGSAAQASSLSSSSFRSRASR